nr:MAG TPA: hypothetical protein [Caudoviricetes sp.]
MSFISKKAKFLFLSKVYNYCALYFCYSIYRL